MRYQKTQRGWYAVVGRNKRNLWEQIRSVSSYITSRISLKKERMSELATWHQSRISPSDVFLLLPERPQDAPPVGMKRKLAKACSTIAKRNRMHTAKLNLITLHEIRYWFVLQMTIKRSLSRWLGIYTSYRYFLFPCAHHGFKNLKWLQSLWRGNLH